MVGHQLNVTTLQLVFPATYFYNFFGKSLTDKNSVLQIYQFKSDIKKGKAVNRSALGEHNTSRTCKFGHVFLQSNICCTNSKYLKPVYTAAEFCRK